MSELDSEEVYQLYRAALNFESAYKRYQLHPGAAGRRASALAALGTLEAAVDNHVTKQDELLKGILDGTKQEEPPF